MDVHSTGVLSCVEGEEGLHLVAAGGDEHRRCHERWRPLQGGAVPQRSRDLQGTKWTMLVVQACRCTGANAALDDRECLQLWSNTLQGQDSTVSLCRNRPGIRPNLNSSPPGRRRP